MRILFILVVLASTLAGGSASYKTILLTSDISKAEAKMSKEGANAGVVCTQGIQYEIFSTHNIEG
ncbi:MAG: hypothetical protein HQ500_13355 [Flavobacteriales bacterium]|nr:hypothetical protein [Flavobacteriales bacterium]